MTKRTASPTYLFSRSNAQTLSLLTASNLLLGFDYDRVLSPAASAKTLATVRPSTRRLLRRVSELYPSLVISARPPGELARQLRGVNALFVESDAPNAPRVLERGRVDFGCDAVLYVGDEMIDDHVSEFGEKGRLLGVRVGRTTRSAAMYYVRTQTEVDRLLQMLIGLRGNDVARPRRSPASLSARRTRPRTL